MRVKVTDLNLRGNNYPVYVSNDGEFYLELDKQNNEKITATTLELLKVKAFSATREKQKKIAIPFVRWESGRHRYGRNIKSHLVHGTITGIHASNRNILVRLGKDNKSEQDSGYGSHDFLRLTPAEETKYTEMKTSYEALEDEIDKFEEAHKIPVKDEIAKLLATGSEEVPD